VPKELAREEAVGGAFFVGSSGTTSSTRGQAEGEGISRTDFRNNFRPTMREYHLGVSLCDFCNLLASSLSNQRQYIDAVMILETNRLLCRSKLRAAEPNDGRENHAGVRVPMLI
jgi:hypothetical protein